MYTVYVQYRDTEKPPGPVRRAAGGKALHLTISNQSDKPIYEQIVQQIKGAILSGELSEGDALPSLRSLSMAGRRIMRPPQCA